MSDTVAAVFAGLLLAAVTAPAWLLWLASVVDPAGALP